MGEIDLGLKLGQAAIECAGSVTGKAISSASERVADEVYGVFGGSEKASLSKHVVDIQMPVVIRDFTLQAQPVFSQKSELVVSNLARMIDSKPWGSINKRFVSEWQKAAQAEQSAGGLETDRWRAISQNNPLKDYPQPNDNWVAAIRAPQLRGVGRFLSRKMGLAPGSFDHKMWEQGHFAKYDLGTGQVTIKTPHFAQGSSKLVNFYGHEATHREQDDLIVRRLADGLNLDADKSGRVAALQAEYHSKMGYDLTSDFASQILKRREGRSLSAPETSRAEKLIDSFVEEAENRADSRVLEQSAIKLHNAIEGKGGLLLAAKTFSESSDLGDLRLRQRPGFAEFYSSLSNHEDANDILKTYRLSGWLRNQLYKINVENNEKYLGYFHEKEAWGVGDKIERMIRKYWDENPI